MSNHYDFEIKKKREKKGRNSIIPTPKPTLHNNHYSETSWDFPLPWEQKKQPPTPTISLFDCLNPFQNLPSSHFLVSAIALIHLSRIGDPLSLKPYYQTHFQNFLPFLLSAILHLGNGYGATVNHYFRLCNTQWTTSYQNSIVR